MAILSTPTRKKIFSRKNDGNYNLSEFIDLLLHPGDEIVYAHNFIMYLFNIPDHIRHFMYTETIRLYFIFIKHSQNLHFYLISNHCYIFLCHISKVLQRWAYQLDIAWRIIIIICIMVHTGLDYSWPMVFFKLRMFICSITGFQNLQLFYNVIDR